MGSGSGFFISSDGIAVTNYHVIKGSDAAKIVTIDGEEYIVSGVIALDKDLDVAIIKINQISEKGDTATAFPAATLGNSSDIRAGQNIFALGSPIGLQNTISDGIISNINRVIDENTFIQITAPISHGSSGGALVNEYGEVLGITSAGYVDAQNIGFAIPINTVKTLDIHAEATSYRDFAESERFLCWMCTL